MGPPSAYFLVETAAERCGTSGLPNLIFKLGHNSRHCIGFYETKAGIQILQIPAKIEISSRNSDATKERKRAVPCRWCKCVMSHVCTSCATHKNASRPTYGCVKSPIQMSRFKHVNMSAPRIAVHVRWNLWIYRFTSGTCMHILQISYMCISMHIFTVHAYDVSLHIWM